MHLPLQSRFKAFCGSIVLVQPRKTRPCLTERLLMGRKESNQTKSKNINLTAFTESKKIYYTFTVIFYTVNTSSLQCYSVLSDILVKNELCIPLERGSNVLSTGEGFICLSPPSKLKIAVRFCSIYKKTISFSAIVF